FNDENLFIIEERLAQTFIRQNLPNLLTYFSIFGAEKLKSYKIRAIAPKLSLSLGHGLNFLEGEANLEFDGEFIPLFEALNQYRKSSYIQLNDGTQAIVNQDYINKLERIFKKKKEKVSISFFDLPIVEELIEEKIAQESFTHSREIFLGFNKLKEAKAAIPKLKADLRPYQEQGFKWLNYLHQHGLGGCLADDMGLGKTLEAISLLSTIYPRNKLPSLIVMPKSLLFNWETEIDKFNPNLSHYTYYSNNRDLETAKKKNLILTTYGMVRNDIEKLKEEEFYFIILDESQQIKNLESQISKAVMLLKSKHRLALSGTPIENNLGELYSLFRFLNPAMFGSINDFNRFYAGPIQQQNDKEVVHELKKKIYPFILRRLKKDVLKDLPEKIEQTLFVDMTDAQKKLYEARRIFYQQTIKEQIGRNGIQNSQFYIFQALNELRQIASIPEAKSEGQIDSPKREVLIESIMDAVSNGHKVLVFANFLNAIEYIGEDLEKRGLEYLVMTGATQDRKALVERFQNDPQIKVFLMTLKTGGIGLNLTAADTIFIFDPWWNRSVENQAVDRTHRIGQDKTVFSYRLITKASIEEKILQLQEKKKELFENIISADSASLKSLTENDVEFILG
ncbi:MAG: DEAD/DEAH box helicase, partial [bacterium]